LECFYAALEQLVVRRLGIFAILQYSGESHDALGIVWVMDIEAL
jgi:hypothetical protein